MPSHLQEEKEAPPVATPPLCQTVGPLHDRAQAVQWIVSLGLYRDKSRAKVRVEELASKDFATRIKPWMKTESAYVLTVSGVLDEQVAELIVPLPHSEAEPAESCNQLASR